MGEHLEHGAAVKTSFPNLKHATIKYALNAELQHFLGLSALQSLKLEGCGRLTDAWLQHLSGLPALTTLDLDNCDKLTDNDLQTRVGDVSSRELASLIRFRLQPHGHGRGAAALVGPIGSEDSAF